MFLPALLAILLGAAVAGPVRPGLAVMQLRAHAGNASTAVIARVPGAPPTSLASLGHECKCHYKGSCSCKASVEFLECISHACSTGLCDCKEQQYFSACTSLERACPSLGFECSGDTATCTVQATAAPPPTGPPETIETLSEDLEELREKKCELIDAHHDGWLNADERLAETEALIAKKSKRLQELGGSVPDMSCARSEGTIEDKPAPKEVLKRKSTPGKSVSQTKVSSPKPMGTTFGHMVATWGTSVVGILVLVVATAWVYHKHNELKVAGQGPHCGIYSVLCCICCTPATICCPIDATKQ